MPRSLVLQLQEEIYSGNSSVSDLLRKALTVAWKLDVVDILDWIQHEQNGYSADTDVPEYRVLRGDLHTQTPYAGLVPFIIKSKPQLHNKYSRYSCRQAIGEVEDLVRRPLEGSSQMAIHLPALIQLAGGAPAYLIINPSTLQNVLEAVKNHLLKWALQLEQAGILGDGLSFSDKEKQLAQETKYIVNVHGSISNSSLQINSPYASQNVAHADKQEELRALLQRAREELGSTGDAFEAYDQIEIIEQELLESPKPDGSRLTSAMTALKPAAETLGSIAKLVELVSKFF